MPIASYDPKKYTLGQLLGATSPAIRVPDYQRDYSWQTKQVEDFWNDLLSFDQQFPGTEINGKEYFLGSAVLVRTPLNHLLLDGQQRLATTTIFLSAFRDRLRSVNTNAANQIQSEYIVFQDHLTDGSKKYKLELNIFDRDFFRSHIQDEQIGGAVPLPPTQRSHKLILGAKKFIDAKIEKLWGNNAQDALKRTTRLAQILTHNFGLVSVVSSDEDHAASIFETLNDRGIGLSTADLLRSWLLTEVTPTGRNEMLRLWTEIFKATKKHKPEVVIRASWVSQYGDVKARSMYKEIKQRLKEKSIGPLVYTRRLRTDAAIFAKLTKAATQDPVIDEVCRGLARLKAAGCFATLMAAFTKLNDSERSTIARALATLTVRHNLVCRFDPTQLEATAFAAAREISGGATLETVINQLRQLSPDDATFEERFTKLSFRPSQHPLVQIILRTIENARKNTGEKIIAGPKRVHIEHVYPQTPAPEHKWQSHTAMVYRLGNLTLLSAKLNITQQNLPFSEKKQFLLQSDFRITQEIAALDAWTESDVQNRQSKLCEEAKVIWPQSLV